MSGGRMGQPSMAARNESSSASRPVDLQGDSPELVAFALLRYLAQLEQPRASAEGIVFDREWLLDAYAECLEAVRGERGAAAAPAPRKPAAAAKKSGRR
jgi:hypothetical protein